MSRPRITDGESGSTLVEFALVLPVLLVILFGVVDFGRAVNYWIDSTHLANEAARYAAVNRNPGGGQSLQDWIQDQATTSELRDGGTDSVASGATVCIEFPNGKAAGEPVKVTVASNFNWLPFFESGVVGDGGIASTSITGQATMRLEVVGGNVEAGCSSA